MKSRYTKLNLEKSNRSVSQGAERTKVREHLKVYKDIVANFLNSASIQVSKIFKKEERYGKFNIYVRIGF
ncbi:MAG: palindromic element RPE5 domain-containing protein [Rickettsia endosymbiont of Pentastiridius leporinus]